VFGRLRVCVGEGAGSPGHHTAVLKNTQVEHAAGVDQTFRVTIQGCIEDLLQLGQGDGSGTTCCVNIF
jgi:hypothetical protein